MMMILLREGKTIKSKSLRTPIYNFPTNTTIGTTVIIQDDDSEEYIEYASFKLTMQLFLVDIIIGFDDDHLVSESSGWVEVCIKDFNAPTIKTAAEASENISRFEIQLIYESVNGSASEC